MSFTKGKTDLFNKVGILNSLSNATTGSLGGILPNLPSINLNTKDPISFLFDILVLLQGSGIVKKVVLDFLNKNGSNIEDTTNTTFKSSILSIVPNINAPSIISTDGIDIPLPSLDRYNILKTDPSSELGKANFNSQPNDMTKQIFNNVLQNPNSSTQIGLLNLTYKINNNTLNVKYIGSFTQANDIISSIINDSSFSIIDYKRIIANTIDILFGVFLSLKGKKVAEKEKELEQYIENIINEEDVTKLNIQQLNQDLEKVNKPSYDIELGCGIKSIPFTLSDINDITTTNENIGDVLSFKFSSKNTNSIGNDSQLEEENFYRNIFRLLPRIIIREILKDPKIIIVLVLIEFFIKGSEALNNIDTRNIVQNSQTFISNFSNKLLNESFYNQLLSIVSRELRKSLLPLQKQVINEKIIAYSKTLTSLI